jgi:hypothetical protein
LVKPGDEIKTGQTLGKTTLNSGGNSEIEFVIMEVRGKNKINLDPERWISKRYRILILKTRVCKKNCVKVLK